MATADFDLSAFNDPSPAPVAHALPLPDPNSVSPSKPSAPVSSESPPKRSRTRKLPYRAANNPIQEPKYRGRRTSRNHVGLDADSLGLDVGSLEDVEPHGGQRSLMEGLSDDSESEGENMDVPDDPEVDDVVRGEEGGEPRQEGNGVGERELVVRLTEAEERDRMRAAAIRIQKDQYDAAVNMRIRLEPLVSLARKLPASEQRSDWEGGDELQELERSTLRVLETLEESVQRTWAASWPEQEEGKKEDNEFESWRDEVMDHWGRKIGEATGKIPKGGFKTIDDSISGHMKAALSSGKHLKKSQRVKERMEIIGGGEVGEGFNEEMYDDGDLYRVLLREIIESGGGGGGGLRYSRLSKGGKVKKKRDRMLAKGRRLKYDIQEKLVGFLTPVPLPDPGPLDEIVAAMFGKRGTVSGAS